MELVEQQQPLCAGQLSKKAVLDSRESSSFAHLYFIFRVHLFVVPPRFSAREVVVQYSRHALAVTEKTGTSSLIFEGLRNEDKEQFNIVYLVLFFSKKKG
jgi:hypothetical protein